MSHMKQMQPRSCLLLKRQRLQASCHFPPRRRAGADANAVSHGLPDELVSIPHFLLVSVNKSHSAISLPHIVTFYVDMSI